MGAALAVTGVFILFGLSQADESTSSRTSRPSRTEAPDEEWVEGNA